MKKMFLFLPMAALLLAACNNSSAPTASVSTINGTTQRYTGGAATLKLLAKGATGSESADNPALSSAPISAAGAFTLALPSAASVSPYLSTIGNPATSPAGCTGSLNVSDSTANTYGVNTLLAGNTVLYSDTLTSSSGTSATDASASASYKIWIYADKPTTISGTVNCTDTSSGVTTTTATTYNAAFRQGWNILSLLATATSTSTTFRTTMNASLSSDGPSVWTTAALSTQALDPQATAARNAVLRAVAFFR
ncbi:hypothetical protein [Deinococcus sp. UYEF24]